MKTILKPDIALVHALSEWPGLKLQEPQNLKGIITLIMTKNEGKWLIRALHNTIREEV